MYTETVFYTATLATNNNETKLDDNIIEQEITKTVDQEGQTALKHIAKNTGFIRTSAPLAGRLTGSATASTEKNADGSKTESTEGSVKITNDDRSQSVKITGKGHETTHSDGTKSTGASVTVEVEHEF
jgi:hypothetical protein